MRAVVQRVFKAKVEVEGKVLGEIGRGLVVFAGVGNTDSSQDLQYIADKIANLRVFEDGAGKMNSSPVDINADILVISNFTVYGDMRHGRRPDFTAAARPDAAKSLYEKFVETLKKYNLKVESGEFQAMMNVVVENDGPVTILLDSKKGF
jgi:D-tyrosyl-tRNA(Tyr) deacylase